MTVKQGDGDYQHGSQHGSVVPKDTPEDLSQRFSLVSGGAFHAVLGRLGLLASDGLPSAKAAAALALLTWLAPTLTALAQTALGFLALFPSVFSGLVFALSCVIAGAMIKALALANYSEQTVGWAVATWVILVLLIFFGPLLFFVRPLHNTRERGLLEYGRLAQLHHLDFHRKWIKRSNPNDNLLGSPDPSSVSDLNGSVEAVLNMRLIPIDKTVVGQLLLAACIPMIAVLLYLMPVAQLLQWIVGVVL